MMIPEEKEEEVVQESIQSGSKMVNYFKQKNEVTTNINDLFAKIKDFTNKIEVAVVKDKKFGYME